MVALLLALVSAFALVSLGDLRGAVVPAVGVLLAWGAGVSVVPLPRGGPRRVLLAALAVRAILLASPASLDDDAFRGLWEGRVVAMGGDPYTTPPAEREWEGAAWAAGDEMRARVVHGKEPSTRLPAALWAFASLGAMVYDPLSVKIAAGLADALLAACLAAVLALRGRSTAGAWLYALHPLGAVAAAGSGRIDVAALLCMALAIRAWNRGEAGVGWAALGAMAHPLPALLLPRLWSRRPWLLVLALATAVLMAVPFAEGAPAVAARVADRARDTALSPGAIGLLLALGIAAWALRSRRDPADVALWTAGAAVALGPWSGSVAIAWAWVPALLAGVRAFTVLAALAPLSYLALGGLEPSALAWAVRLPFLAALLLEVAGHLRRPGPWARAERRGGERRPAK